jgi:hypothetical protein
MLKLRLIYIYIYMYIYRHTHTQKLRVVIKTLEACTHCILNLNNASISFLFKKKTKMNCGKNIFLMRFIYYYKIDQKKNFLEINPFDSRFFFFL